MNKSDIIVINNTPEYHLIWNKVYSDLKFKPSCAYRGHSMNVPLPFEIDMPYSVYAIDDMTDEQIDLSEDLVMDCLINCSNFQKNWYALDWQHSAFRFSPHNIDRQQKVIWVRDRRYSGGGYNAYFPPFCPDGDYYFFIDEDFANGYLGHPWRQEIWVFGSDLINEIQKIYQQLGWTIVK